MLPDIKGLSHMLTQRLRKSKTTTAAANPGPTLVSFAQCNAAVGWPQDSNAWEAGSWNWSANTTYASPKSSSWPCRLSRLLSSFHYEVINAHAARPKIGGRRGFIFLQIWWWTLLVFLAHVKMLLIKNKNGTQAGNLLKKYRRINTLAGHVDNYLKMVRTNFQA